ncbi:MAG: hypothetical protein ACD_79C01351G0001 [uncultured bacterium]|nr:MAG: hypothetical protein ACD_79C01351G0001 [uncultured bacterium]
MKNINRTTEEDIYQSKKDWEDCFESITDMITIHDQDYNIIRANKAAKALLKLPALEKKLKSKCFSFYHGADAPPAGCPSCNCLKSGLPGVFEFFEPYLNRYLEIRAIPRFDSNNQRVGLIHVVRDITERKQAEQELIKAKEKAEESDRLKTAFLANMSHEIRTPLNGILGFTEILKQPNLTEEELNECLGVIEKGGKRMLNIINDLIDISKIEAGLIEVKLSKSNVNEQIENIYNSFKSEAEQKGIKIFLKNSLLAKDATIKEDREKVYAILTNLVNNAIKFTSEGYIEIGCEKKGKYLEFFVKDTGTGIPQEQKEFIFERFRQGRESLARSYEGSGLGLAISKAYVDMLGGKIWVVSELEKGSVFYFTIPYNFA